MSKFIMLVQYTHRPEVVEVLKVPGTSYLVGGGQELFHEMGRSLLKDFTIKAYQVAELQGDMITLRDLENEY